MPIRDKFPQEYFDTNPLAGETPHGAFKRLQWGKEPSNTFKIEAPEPMAVLGRLAKLFYLGGKNQTFPDWDFFVSVGTRTNWVYLVPMENRKPLDFPKGFAKGCIEITLLKRIDYYSEKGGEDGYYYHDHEKPYPMLWGNDDHFVIQPANNRGRRSYAVNDEGIIG